MARRVMPWLKRDGRVNAMRRRSRARALLRGNKGLATIEFALAGGAFLLAVLFLMDLGLQQFTQAAMDAATQAAARQIQIGTYRTALGHNLPNLQAMVCARLSVLAPGCDATSLTVSAASGIQFSGLTRATPPFTNIFSPGGSRDYVLLQIAFKRPQLILVGGFTQPYLVSSVIFENEQ